MPPFGSTGPRSGRDQNRPVFHSIPRVPYIRRRGPQVRPSATMGAERRHGHERTGGAALTERAVGVCMNSPGWSLIVGNLIGVYIILLLRL